jgi:hypothetical protein
VGGEVDIGPVVGGERLLTARVVDERECGEVGQFDPVEVDEHRLQAGVGEEGSVGGQLGECHGCLLRSRPADAAGTR